MSGDELKSIEKNGNYWLSQSNTAYHIINPNATSLTTIEANGYYSLAKGGDTYYVLDGSGSSIRLYYDGVGRSMFGPNDSTGIYTPTNVEENPFDSGFLVLGYRNDKPEWNNSSFFNYNNFGFEFDTLGKYTGSDLKTVNNHTFPRPGIEYEPVFGLDLNDDGNIATGANPPNLLNISTNQHHIDDGHVSDGIILKRDNVTINPNSNGGLNATQVEKNGDHYELLLVHANVKYDVWKVDASGNFVSSIKAKLWQDEVKFNVDLNGDGDTGLVTVEDNGNVHLKHGDNTFNGAPQYYIVDGSNEPVGITKGLPIGPNSLNGWSATQVEESASGGYEVFWSHSSGITAAWKLDASGNYEKNITAKLWQHEETFEVDLDADNIIGIPLTTIEAIGDYDLTYANGYGQYYIVTGNGGRAPGDVFKGGADRIGITKGLPIGPNSLNGWSATQVEESASGGYEVFWSHSSGITAAWKLDASGNYEKNITAKLWQHEETFEVDLDADNIIGIPLTTIEAIGDYDLTYANGYGQYYIVTGNGGRAPGDVFKGGADRIGITKGLPIGPNSLNGWSATQVEESASGGYEVFWSHSSGITAAWKLDASGNYEKNITAKLWQHENTFQIDLNGDLTQGLVTIENIGDVYLAIGDNRITGDTQYYIIDGSKDPIGLTRGGSNKGPNSSTDWSVTHVEASASGGYEVLWSHGSGKFQVWKVDALGSYVSHVNAHLWQHENTFQIDLNGDLTQGLVTIENIGDVYLAIGDNRITGDTQYYIIDGSKDPIGLTRGGSNKGPNSSTDWSVTHVEASASGGYEVLWSHGSGKFQVWKVDALGSYVSHVNAHLWQHENTFQIDLNGDLTQGLVTIENIGDVYLAIGDNRITGDTQYYIIDGSKDPIGLTRGGSNKGPNSSTDWSVTHVEASASGGYEVLWSHGSGKFQVWKVDALGSYQWHISANNIVTENGSTHIKFNNYSWKFGGNGDEILTGRSGNDTIDGGDGNDHINGYSGHDTLKGGDGDDIMSGDGGSGYAGNDILFGNAGNDWLRGRKGDDELYGGDGDDILIGDLGSDTITTGSGSDQIILRARDDTLPSGELSEADTITDFTDGIDVLSVTQGDVDIHYSQLTIAQGSGSNSNDTIIKYGSEYLAILKNINVDLLFADDFTPVGIALDIA